MWHTVTPLSQNKVTSLSDVFTIDVGSEISRDMEDAALHIIKNKMAQSDSPEIQFKTGGRVSTNFCCIFYWIQKELS